jgi:hypothetical protein
MRQARDVIHFGRIEEIFADVRLVDEKLVNAKFPRK